MSNTVPTLRERLLPLVLFGYVVAAIRLGWDFCDRESAMWFGLYWLMPAAIAVVGFTFRWGKVSWPAMALTMLCASALIWGVWNTISYTTGQFMEWGKELSDGRYFAGTEKLVDGEMVRVGQRADIVREGTFGKFSAGALHGLISTLTGTVWSTTAGTLFIWLPARLRC